MNDITYAGMHSLMMTVSRHAHESWECILCTYGSGVMLFDQESMPYKQGDVVIIPPMVAHANTSETGFRNIHINMTSPSLTLKKPALITDDSNHFLLDAFTAVHYHFHSDRKEKTSLLSAYGNLICCYLTAYQTARPLTRVVEEIESDIISHCADCDYRLDEFLRAQPFSYDYLRKLFQKELGVTPHKYLTNRRLQSAADMLINAEINGSAVMDIARQCGFRDSLYFSKMFKKEFGVSPSYYAQHKRQEEEKNRLDPASVKVSPRDQ